jgi:beta-N-acetylhexosaminidase
MRTLFSFLLFLIPLQAVEVEKLSLEEKIGQMLLVQFIGNEISEDAKLLVAKAHVGGIIYYNWANDLSSPDRVKQLSQGLQGIARIPLFIAVDQEGGVVNRIKEGVTIFPSPYAIGKTGDLFFAEQAAFASARELQALGINLFLAPCIDVNVNPANPAIGIRSFGASVEQVTIFGKATLDGFGRAGMIGCAKHFPGYGDVSVDPHAELPVISKSYAALEKTELPPFRALAPKADMMMTAHVKAFALDPSNPTTFSKESITGVLRNEFGFQGVIATDSLYMQGAIKDAGTIEEAATRSILAGCDLLILSDPLLLGVEAPRVATTRDILRVHTYLVKAVRSGKIPLGTIDASVRRIIELKKKYWLFSPQPPLKFSRKSHELLAYKIAQKSVDVVNCKVRGSLAGKKVALVAPELISTEVRLANLGASDHFFFKTLDPSAAEIASAEKTIATAEIGVFCSYNGATHPQQKLLMERLIASGKPVILLVTRDPRDAEQFPQGAATVITYGPAPASLRAAIAAL